VRIEAESAGRHNGRCADIQRDVVAIGREEIAWVGWPRDAGAGGEASAAQDLARVKPGL